MSDSESEFICSQISNKDYFSSQSACYGGDIVDVEDVKSNGNVVSLEFNGEVSSNVCSENCGNSTKQKVLYDNVMIEDISADEDEGET